MDNGTKIKLPSFISSHEQVYFYIQELNRNRSSVANQEKIKEPLRSYLIGLSETDEISATLIDNFLEVLIETKENAPRFHVVFADYPEREIRTKITSWFRNNIHPRALISFRYDSLLVGGLVVRSRNKIFDFSFRNKLQNSKLKPVDILENVAK
ncbi:MAG: F0F1 ATP synthase subunit delta [Candidatus Spechtbacterales bacterium]|nr:F0F1 ATP synthase subunit delta [Candidatus Spechtbacterales bacterium]